MTQQQIDELRRLDAEQAAMEARHRHERLELRDRRAAAYAKCDHTYPDGRPAWRGGFFYVDCEICHENDM